MRLEIYLKSCMVLFAVVLSGCSSTPNKDLSSENQKIAKQLQELEQMKPGLKRLVAMESDLKSLIGQLNALVDTTSSDGSAQSDNTIVATYEQPQIRETIVQQNTFERSEAAQVNKTSSEPVKEVQTKVAEVQSADEQDSDVIKASTKQQDALVAPVYKTELKYGAQLASLTNPSQLETTWEKFRSKHEVLDDAGVVFEKTTNARGDYYRVKAGPYQTREEAKRICSTLKSQGQDCIVTEIKNEMLYMLASLAK